ncbi:helix-turn-helix transcriptional regulator [Heliobacterium chlorum]|uniref:Helix-turn-helix transcriptional regulator n=1 Tax=Heliobacterium chlorum TaxID=2698 RepID=A0ABR7T8A4_HELCL|nr:helix-turn-helix transcriptional regulator [Heliobacterium chlorum]MBC9786278.1 helix-turn-helix transcriptional regulator [Heliobacterium chlorum]
MDLDLDQKTAILMQVVEAGEYLKELRQKRKLTVTKVSTDIGLKNHSYLSNLERGKVTDPDEKVLRDLEKY